MHPAPQHSSNPRPRGRRWRRPTSSAQGTQAGRIWRLRTGPLDAGPRWLRLRAPSSASKLPALDTPSNPMLCGRPDLERTGMLLGKEPQPAPPDAPATAGPQLAAPEAAPRTPSQGCGFPRGRAVSRRRPAPTAALPTLGRAGAAGCAQGPGPGSRPHAPRCAPAWPRPGLLLPAKRSRVSPRPRAPPPKARTSLGLHGPRGQTLASRGPWGRGAGTSAPPDPGGRPSERLARIPGPHTRGGAPSPPFALRPRAAVLAPGKDSVPAAAAAGAPRWVPSLPRRGGHPGVSAKEGGGAGGAPRGRQEEERSRYTPRPAPCLPQTHGAPSCQGHGAQPGGAPRGCLRACPRRRASAPQPGSPRAPLPDATGQRGTPAGTLGAPAPPRGPRRGGRGPDTYCRRCFPGCR